MIAPSREIARELLAAGYSPSIVRHVPNGVAEFPPPSVDAAGGPALLAEANQELQLPDAAPLTVYTWAGWSRIAVWSGWWRLGKSILRRRPNARLWLIGQGSLRGPSAGKSRF